MTTVVNPTSSPTIYYNRSGRNIQSLAVSSGSGISAVQAVSGDTICLVAVTGTPGGSDGIELPTGSDVGDNVDVYMANYNTACNVFAPSGEDINGFSSIQTTTNENGVRLVKVAANSWVFAR